MSEGWMDGWVDGCQWDGWMDVHGLVTLHYPLIFMTLSDVMDGCMDVWMVMALSPSIILPCIYVMNGWMSEGWTDGMSWP